MIQLTPSSIPEELAEVHLRVSVEGLTFEKLFEADPGLKYKFAWDRRNAYNQKVYGIVSASGKILIKIVLPHLEKPPLAIYSILFSFICS